MKFGKVDVPDSVLWVAGLVLPLAGVVVYRHFHADPTDIVTDVQSSPRNPSAIVIVYNSGPSDTFLVPATMSAFLQTSFIQASKQALAGATRDRVRTTFQK